jgi:hypothetical protein
VLGQHRADVDGTGVEVEIVKSQARSSSCRSRVSTARAYGVRSSRGFDPRIRRFAPAASSAEYSVRWCFGFCTRSTEFRASPREPPRSTQREASRTSSAVDAALPRRAPSGSATPERRPVKPRSADAVRGLTDPLNVPAARLHGRRSQLQAVAPSARVFA